MLKITLWCIKKFEDEELEALLHEDSCQVLAELAESLGVDHTQWQKRKGFLHHMVTSNEKWIHYD